MLATAIQRTQNFSANTSRFAVCECAFAIWTANGGGVDDGASGIKLVILCSVDSFVESALQKKTAWNLNDK